jgi:hypothetical protein
VSRGSRNRHRLDKLAARVLIREMKAKQDAAKKTDDSSRKTKGLVSRG